MLLYFKRCEKNCKIAGCFRSMCIYSSCKYYYARRLASSNVFKLFMVRNLGKKFTLSKVFQLLEQTEASCTYLAVDVQTHPSAEAGADQQQFPQICSLRPLSLPAASSANALTVWGEQKKNLVRCARSRWRTVPPACCAHCCPCALCFLALCVQCTPSLRAFHVTPPPPPPSCFKVGIRGAGAPSHSFPPVSKEAPEVGPFSTVERQVRGAFEDAASSANLLFPL